MLRRGALLTGGLALLGVALAIAFAAAAGASKGDPDGRYTGELTDEDGATYGEVSFKVAKDGRLIKAFNTLVLSVCTNPDAIGGIEVIEVPFSFDRVQVSRDGRFAAEETFAADPPSDSSQTYALSGRLKNGRVRDGTIVLDGKCASNETFDAARARR